MYCFYVLRVYGIPRMYAKAYTFLLVMMLLVLPSRLLHCTPHAFPYGKAKNNSAAEYNDKGYAYKFFYLLGDIVIDGLHLCQNLFSVQSAELLAWTMPFYLATRIIDERIQHPFYNPYKHKNIHQLPRWCHSFAKHSIGIPMVGLSSLALFAQDKDLALTGRMTAIGLPLVQSGKDIIKNLECDSCLRPWHEDFEAHKRSYGGFPSGHTASISYMATLFGLRHGPAWAVPLTALGLFIATDFLTSNRHYLSQIVAGAGLGIIFAYAASAVIDVKLGSSIQILPYSNAQQYGIKIVGAL